MTKPSRGKRRTRSRRQARTNPECAQTVHENRQEAIARYALEQRDIENNPGPHQTFQLMSRFPVTIEEFVESDEFLGNVIEIWPTLMPDLRAMNPDIFIGEPPVHEILLGGATATGKTTLALVTNLYRLYLFTCFDVHRMYDLAPQTPIVFMLQSLSPTITRRVIYEPLRAMFEEMPFAQRYLEWDKGKESSLDLEGNITVVPALANVGSMVGQAIAGGILDEVNFMPVVENSKRVPGPRGQGGRYDQAQEVYRHFSRRRKSRFTTQLTSLGALVVISSTRYKADFLDRRMTEVEEFGEEQVFVSRRKQYDIIPHSHYSGETFPLLIGSDRYPTRILAKAGDAPAGATVERVPIEYLDDFRRDPEESLRDIVGVATDVIWPFIARRDKIIEAIEQGLEAGLEPWADNCDIDLAIDDLPQWRDDRMPADRDRSRWVHIDLALTRDACGVAVVKLLGFVNVADADNPDVVERRPKFAVEAAISIQPSATHELDIAQLRSWIMHLRTRHGINLHTVSYDGFQSQESMQWLRRAGIRSHVISVDRDTGPYEYLRGCLYRDQIVMVDSDTLRLELCQLELRADKNKVDHPPKGSKDVADAVCGAIYAASQYRTTRSQGGYYDRDGQRDGVRTERPRPLGKRRPEGRERPEGRTPRPVSLRERIQQRGLEEWAADQAQYRNRFI